MTDTAGVNWWSVGILWVEHHGLVGRVDLLRGHRERAVKRNGRIFIINHKTFIVFYLGPPMPGCPGLGPPIAGWPGLGPPIPV